MILIARYALLQKFNFLLYLSAQLVSDGRALTNDGLEIICRMIYKFLSAQLVSDGRALTNDGLHSSPKCVGQRVKRAVKYSFLIHGKRPTA